MLRTFIILVMSMVYVQLTAGGKPSLVISHPVAVMDGLSIREVLETSCNPKTGVSLAIFGQLLKNKKKIKYGEVLVGDGPANANRLELEIVDIYAEPGETSGAKKIVVRGVLTTSGGEVIGDFFVAHASLGLGTANFTSPAPGMHADPVKRMCEALKRVNTAIGKDVAKWMNNPTKGALLGDQEEAQKLKTLIANGQWPRKAGEDAENQ